MRACVYLCIMMGWGDVSWSRTALGYCLGEGERVNVEEAIVV